MSAPKSAKSIADRESDQSAQSASAIQDEELIAELALDDSESESCTDLIAEPTPVKAEGEDFDEGDQQ